MVRETRMCLASFACLQPKIGRTLLTLTTPWPSYQIHQGSTHNLQRHFITTCPLLRSFSKIQHCLRPDESGSQFLFPILLRTFFASFKELKQDGGLISNVRLVMSCPFPPFAMDSIDLACGTAGDSSKHVPWWLVTEAYPDLKCTL